MRSFDICIIGNGVLGLSTAYELLLENPMLHIAIIGPSNRPGCASLAAGAMLGAFGEVTKSSFDSKYGQAKLDMAVQSSRMWSDWIEQINVSINAKESLKITPGTFVILNTESSKREDKNFAAIIKALNSYKEPYQEVDPSEIPGLNPIDNCRPLRTIFLPNEGFINPFQVLDTLDSIVRKHQNAVMIDGYVKQLHCHHNEDRISAIETHEGEIIQSTHIVLAAGVYSQALIDQIPAIKKRVPLILSGAGTSFLLKYPNDFKSVVRSPNRVGGCGIHIMPRGNDMLFMGASNYVDVSPKSEIRMRDVYYLVQRAIAQFNQDFHKAEIINWFIGNRPVTVDAFPLIGETSIKGLWLLTGNYRDGFHNAPLLAKSIANQILGKLPPLINHPFQAERMPIQTMSREQAIEEFSDQLLGAGYEHAVQLPKTEWGALLKEVFYKKAEAIYDELDINIGLPFDILVMLEQKPHLISFFRDYYHKLLSSKTAVTC